MTIKDSTKQPEKSTQPGAEEIRALAEHLSAVLKNPLTPPALYNAMSDELGTLAGYIDHDSPEMIERMFTGFYAKQKQEKVTELKAVA